MSNISFIDEKGTFSVTDVDVNNNLYFPIANELGIKSCVTPKLGGDSKIDQNTFILEPTSIENLHNNRSARNFWCITEQGYWSATGNSDETESKKYTSDREVANAKAGFMWYETSRKSEKYGLESKIVSYVPYNKDVEIMMVEIKNISDKKQLVSPVAAVPIYGRSADNLRDHRHVTSLLHRIRTTENGVYVRPTLSFDERGHQKNIYTYYVCGITENGQAPVSFYPTVDDFLGVDGSYTNPRAVALNLEGAKSGEKFEGLEAVGAMKFAPVELDANASATYIVLIGATTDEDSITSIINTFSTKSAVEANLSETEKYWNDKVNLCFNSGNKDFDNYLRWISFQPLLRRIYGCSFLPHHDYGKGGRGWRDLWQDCLALLIMDPEDVGQMILDNFGGVRADGTNATIIGSKQGEFVADRNGITRVWMDHGMWPFMTTKLYMEQTGDLEILGKKVSYFKDGQVHRGNLVDEAWDLDQGNKQMDASGNEYKGTVLEHLIMQHMCAMFETGEHGNILLRGADWNDAIDMATKRGESVAFTCAYSGNLLEIADYVRKLGQTGAEITLLEEIVDLLKANSKDGFDAYLSSVQHTVSGKAVAVDYNWLAEVLEKTANDMIDHIRANEWITDGEGNNWFNSYYDDNGRRVEGKAGDDVRMMLTGQVFSIMSGTASKEQVADICKAADKYLFEEAVGGYKLNTNFHEEKYDMGRMFGFAYGEKENGAVFSHMTVMYANALYKRGFVKEGYKALMALTNAAMNQEVSMIFPGVPEYFNAKGKGMYNYLTGAASWYALTMVTEILGIKGANGNLHLEPKLVGEQFNDEGKNEASLVFAGKNLKITFVNSSKKDFGDYKVTKCSLDGETMFEGSEDFAEISLDKLAALDNNAHSIEVVLS